MRRDDEGLLVYCATPARLKHKMKVIMNFVTKCKCGPLHPFQALPLERFEKGPIGRERTMDFCLRLMKICDEFWLFGVSEGTLTELTELMKLKEVGLLARVKIRMCLGYDPKWKEEYEKLKDRFGDPFSKINMRLPWE